MRPPAIALLATVLACAPGRAQEDDPSWLHQQADGRWAAARADGDLRTTSLTLLALLGDGSTLRSGPYRTRVRDGVRWLRAQLDEQGRFALRTDPGWPLDHAIATYALAEAFRLSTYRTLRPQVEAAVATLVRHVATARPRPGVELRLWCALVEQSLRAADAAEHREAAPEPSAAEGPEPSAAEAPEPSAAEGPARPEMPRLATSVDALRRVLDALPAPALATPREEAAQLLLATLHGGRTDVADVLPHLEQPLLDPLRAFYAAAAAFRTGGPDWKRASKHIETAVVRTQVRDGEHRFTWAPTGEFGDTFGRRGTTAALMLTLQVYYRYCKLSLFD